MTTLALTIANTAIRQDERGRYYLNDLHKASGGEKRHQPSDWLRIQQTQELIQELTPGIPVVTVEGRNGGTYVVRELVYAYAMWISAQFHLAVIRAYDALMSQPSVTPDLLEVVSNIQSQLSTLAVATQASIAALAQALDVTQRYTQLLETHQRKPRRECRAVTREDKAAIDELAAQGHFKCRYCPSSGHFTHIRFVA